MDSKVKQTVDEENQRKKEQRKQYFFVIRELTSRETKRKYSRSYLGILWSVLNPLLSMAVLSLIFTQIFARSIENYPIYYLSGYILWHMFTGATNAAMTTLVDNKMLLIKVKLPMEVFVLARVYTALVNLGYSFIAYILVLFVLGISYILSAAYVFFGDVKHLYSVILTLWMYCSAIFYPVDRLEGGIRIVIENNPIFIFINCMRNIILYGVMPSLPEFIKMSVWGIGVYIFGYWVFKKKKNMVMQKV